MSDGLSRIWMSMALLVSIAAFGLGVPAGAAPAAPGAPAAPAASRVVSDASCSAPAPHGFSDVPTSHWATTAIAWLVEAKITGGTGPGKYSPNAGVTRAQMAQFLWANADKPAPTASHGFTDVTASHWANTAIAWLVEAEITGGTGPGKYSPNARVTRAQMAQFLWANACAPSSPTPKLSMDAGNEHTCAVKPNRTAKCWGYNHYGQLGDGTKTGRNTPTPVIALRNVTEITTGGNHTCALSTNGTVKCWGYNTYGQLGDSTTTDRLTPTPVAGLTNVATISAGARHTCATLTNNTAKCWGSNLYSQLGSPKSGDTSMRTSPTQVTGLTNATTIAAGNDHTCATINNGSAQCWGWNPYGQLGDGTEYTQRTNNTAKCWGSNVEGQLGDGTTTKRLTPTPVTGL